MLVDGLGSSTERPFLDAEIVRWLEACGYHAVHFSYHRDFPDSPTPYQPGDLLGQTLTEIGERLHRFVSATEAEAVVAYSLGTLVVRKAIETVGSFPKVKKIALLAPPQATRSDTVVCSAAEVDVAVSSLLTAWVRESMTLPRLRDGQGWTLQVFQAWRDDFLGPVEVFRRLPKVHNCTFIGRANHQLLCRVVARQATLLVP